MKTLSVVWKWVGTDGLLHITCSTVIVLIAGMFISILGSVLVALAIGVAKEVIWDKLLKKGSPSWHDIICDLIGVAIAVIVLLLYKFLA